MPVVSSDQITASAAIKTSEGLLYGIILEATDANANQVVTIYDNSSAGSGVKLAEIKNITATAGAQERWSAPGDGIHAENGMYCTITGSANVIVYYK